MIVIFQSRICAEASQISFIVKQNLIFCLRPQRKRFGMRGKEMKKGRITIIGVIATLIIAISGYFGIDTEQIVETVNESRVEQEQLAGQENEAGQVSQSVSIEAIPEYTGSAYVAINDNVPALTEADYTEESFETYSDLDSLGRCGVAYANVGVDIMPTEDRGEIGHVKPTGWQSVKYDNVDGKYLYNRCHLIGFQLTGENANKENLITGTRYFNVDGMLPFENMVADYVKETQNHVLYRVTPFYEGNDLVASGVQMEAWSVEDNGEGICFNVYVYNIQPGIEIDYATGESKLAEQGAAQGETDESEVFVLNTSGKKFHLPNCSSVSTMKAENKEEYTGSREDLISQGYEACGKCKP